MKIQGIQGSLTEVKCDVLIINLFKGVTAPAGGTGAINKALDNLISSYVIEKEQFEGELNKTYVLPTYGKLPADKVVLVGLGESKKFDLNKVREVSATALRKAQELNAKTVCTILHGAGVAGFKPGACAQSIAEGTLIASYKFDKYKSKKEDKNNKVEEFSIVELENDKIEQINKGIEKGKTIADGVNFARDLVNEPAGELTPSKLAQTAHSLKGITCKILEKNDIQKLGMGAFLSVAKGSNEPPKFIHMTYKPKNPKAKIAIIGKGLTFDSGGLDLKPRGSMVTMKDDMGGSATVVGVMSALPTLKPEVEVHAIVAACENMPGCSAYKPGDVLTAMNNKTIEVDNTDAEGRLTLADAICYANTLKVDKIIDIATLTGACVVALGRFASGIMGNNQDLIDDLINAGDDGGERLWQLPLYEDYFNSLKSDIADFKNAGSREGGAQVAGIFLSKFAQDTPWAHIDIAGPAWLDKNVKEMPKGATGAGVRTLINYILSL